MTITEDKALKPVGFHEERLSLNDGFIHSTMNKLNLNSQKSWLYLVYRSFHKLKHKDTFEVPIKDLTTYLQGDTRNYNYLNDCLKGIRRTFISYNITGKDNSDWMESPLLADVGIMNGNIVYSFSPFMREKLQDPKFFTVLNLTLISNFKSKYSLAIYRQLASYIIKNQVITQKKYTLEELKYYLQIDEEYSEFRLFNDKVLKPSVDEINEFTPLNVRVEFKRANRKVSEIKFIFSLKKNMPVDDVIEVEAISEPGSNTNTLSEKITSFCINNDFPVSFIEKYRPISLENGISDNEYHEYMEFIIERVSKMKKGMNKAGTLTNSLKDSRFIIEFKNRFNKIPTAQDKLDLEMKKLLEKETETYIKTEYESHIRKENIHPELLDYKTFKMGYEKDKAKEITKFKKTVFIGKFSNVYGTSPYLVSNSIMKRLNL